MPESAPARPVDATAPSETARELAPDRFVHLHSHSEYSLLDGLNDPHTLVRTAGHLGQTAFALTDHGRLSGTALFVDAIAWYNRVHAERHSPSERCASSGCHSVEDCRPDPRCPKHTDGAPPEAHAKLPPIRGILGIETYVAHHGAATRERGDWGHLVLLAMDEVGWANLRLLASRASLEGFYSKPRIDMAMLREHHEGLIALSSCLGGHIPYARRLAAAAAREAGQSEEEAIAAGDAAGKALATEYRDLFGDRYYLELQWHNDQDLSGPPRAREQWDHNAYLLGLSAELGIPLTIGNDLHYATRELAPLEEIVLATSQQMSLAEVAEAKRMGKNVLSFDTPDFYVKSRAEMAAALADWLRIAEAHDPAIAAIIRAQGRGWLDSTLEIAARCVDYTPFRHGLHFPVFPVPAGQTPESYLEALIWERAKGRYPQMSERTRRLIEYELQCVQELGFGQYFLITMDFCDYARKQGVENDDPVIDIGLGRGSAPGSVVTYVLGITDVDPIAYGLSEGGIGLTRFLNPTVLYAFRESAFGDLDEACLARATPDAETMEADIAAALNGAFRTRRDAIKTGLDPETGAPVSPERTKALEERFTRDREWLLEEWSAIKRWGIANAAAKPVGDPPRFRRDSVVAPLWRWLKHIEAGHPAGERNAHWSYVAKFLGLSSATVRRLLGEGLTVWPVHEFAHSRKSMPDIDIDFTPGPDGREKVMRYISDKYGSDHVAQIATFNALLAKSAIKDVARAKGLPAQEADALTLLVPKKFQGSKDDTGEEEIPGVSLREMVSSTHPAVVEGSAEMRAAMARDPKVDEIIRLASQIEGMKRNVSTHACGVLVTPTPVTDFVSVEKVSGGTGQQAVHDGPTLTDGLGLLKVDFLGLKNLKVNRECCDRIRERTGVVVDWRTVPDDDPDAMALLREGRTMGIFQFNSDFATGILKRMKPKRVQDLMVATALGRPGPMEYIPDYVNARAAGHGDYGDPVFERIAKPILEETYGILVYQEQVMLLAIALADFTLPESDGLRKATAKKSAEMLAKFRGKFVEGAVAKGTERGFIEHYWDSVLVPFASYSFNKSHSTAYALTAYKQAYLKAHHGPEFLAALMTVDQHETAKERGAASPLAKEIVEARRSGYEVLPIDIARSTERIEVEDLPDPDGPEGTTRPALRMSLASVKGIGERPVAAILAARAAGAPFASLCDFFERCVEVEREKDAETGKTIPAAVNKTAVLNLAKVGAFDAFGERGTLVDIVAEYFGTTSKKRRDALPWGSIPGRIEGPTPHVYLEWEQELLGYYGSAHPADAIAPVSIDAFVAAATAAEVKAARENGKAARDPEMSTVADCLAYERARDSELRLLSGIVSGLAYKPFRSGNGGRILGLIEDQTGQCKLTIWGPRDSDGAALREAFAALRTRLETDTTAFALGVSGSFSFDAKWDKAPGFMVGFWQELAYARREEPEPPEAVPATPSQAPVKVARDKDEVDKGLVALFE